MKKHTTLLTFAIAAIVATRGDAAPTLILRSP